MKCRELMQTHVFRLRSTNTVAQAASLMRDAQIGFVAVTDERDRVSGVVTDRDLALRVVAEDRPASTPLAEVMTAGPLVLFSPDEDVAALERRMAETKTWRALALDEVGRPIGMISVVDVAHREMMVKAATSIEAVTTRDHRSPQF